MTQSEFVYWLNGYVDICGARPDDRQWQIIKDHLTLTFNKVTPDRAPKGDTVSINSNVLPLRTYCSWNDVGPTLNQDGTPIVIARTC